MSGSDIVQSNMAQLACRVREPHRESLGFEPREALLFTTGSVCLATFFRFDPYQCSYYFSQFLSHPYLDTFGVSQHDSRAS